MQSSNPPTRVTGDFRDRQFAICCDLFLLQALRHSHETIRTDYLGYRDRLRHGTALETLNWVSQFFVHQAKGDVVATAYSIEQGRVTLFVANSHGGPRPEDHDASARLLALIRDRFRNALDDDALVTALRRLALHTSAARISHKLALLACLARETPGGMPIAQWLEGAFDRWEARGHREEARPSGQFGEASWRDNQRTGDAVKQLLRQLGSMLARPPTLTGRASRQDSELTALMAVWGVLERLVWTAFFQDIEKAPANFYSDRERGLDVAGRREYALLAKVRRRIWRVLRYYTVPVRFVKTSLRQFHDMLALRDPGGVTGMERFLSGSGGIVVHWVTCAPRRVVYDRRQYKLQDRAWSLVASYGLGAQRDSPPVRRMLDGIARLPSWSPEVAPRVHCAVQLTWYLVENNIQVYKDTIGMSKLLCWACHLYVDQLRVQQGARQWRLSGTSGKVHEAWTIPSAPSVEASRQAVERVTHDLKEVLVRCLSENGLAHPGFSYQPATRRSNAYIDGPVVEF